MAEWYKSKRATTVFEEDGMMHCKYHDTCVVSWNEDKIILRTGGYKSVTTKVRMNEVAWEYKLPYGVYQKNHQWYVSQHSPHYVDCPEWDEKLYYFDGEVIELTREEDTRKDCDHCHLERLARTTI